VSCPSPFSGEGERRESSPCACPAERER